MPSARSNVEAVTGETLWSPAPVPASAAALEAAGHASHLARLLARRGVEHPEDAGRFLAPDLDQLHDPQQLHGVAEAVERLLEVRARGGKVAVVGDYDVDGVSGTALLSAVLGACQIGVETILPHRMRDGYGFQPVHVERARELGCSLVITVDCGTTSHAAAEEALARGLGVVVTDHHLPGAALPDGVVQINPKQDDCDYPFAELCGAGLALKLALALAAACERQVDPRLLLRIACLGTIADLVPLLGENRVIAAIGLRELGRTRSPGLQALMRVSRLRPPLKADDVGFRLGPRLNAPGRLGSAEPALELLLARDPRRAAELATELDQVNRQRQDWEQKVADEAREAFLARGELPAILVAWSEGWHRGVVGIAAGRLARELNRPTILLAADGETATGSGRSIPRVHLFHFLEAWKDELPRFGGHAQAIGLTARLAELDDLRRRWEEAAAERFSSEVATRCYEYELDLEAREVTPELFAELRRLEPHGQGNPQPLVRVRGPLHLARAPRAFGKGHLSGEAVAKDGGRIRYLGWGWQRKAGVLTSGDFELLGTLEHDNYRGGIVLRLHDGRPWRED